MDFVLIFMLIIIVLLSIRSFNHDNRIEKLERTVAGMLTAGLDDEIEENDSDGGSL